VVATPAAYDHPVKYVYPVATMTELRSWFYREIAERLPSCRVLYWT